MICKAPELGFLFVGFIPPTENMHVDEVAKIIASSSYAKDKLIMGILMTSHVQSLLC